MIADRPTGEQLVEELRVAAEEAGVRLPQFVGPLIGGNPWAFLHQLERARLPTSSTVERVRALCAGGPLPAHRRHALRGETRDNVHRVTDGESRLCSAEIERRQALAEWAHAERLPGETVHAAALRLRHQQQTIDDLGGQ